MALAKYVGLLWVCTFLCWLAWLLIIFFMNPEAGIRALLFFYVSLFLSLIGTFTGIGYWLRQKFRNEEIAIRSLAGAFRQSVFFSLMVCAALLLQSHNYLRWWNFIALAAIAALVDLFFLSKKAHN